VAEQYAELLEIAAVLGEDLRVLPETEALEPSRQGVHQAPSLGQGQAAPVGAVTASGQPDPRCARRPGGAWWGRGKRCPAHRIPALVQVRGRFGKGRSPESQHAPFCHALAPRPGFRSDAINWGGPDEPRIVLGGLADVERDLIRTRTAEGRSRAKAQGRHLGRPPAPDHAAVERGYQTAPCE
jgi:hypothetical protein